MVSSRRPEGRIGRYRLVGQLATGGMAEIYLALSGELSGFRTLVVVKRILPHLASNAEFIRMFFDEARIAALLDHPNIVRILEVGQDDDEYFLAMEVVQGKPLSALLRRAVKREQPLSHAQSAFIVAQVAKGLAYAHNLVDNGGTPLGLVHRDVSPQNVLVSFDGAIKVIDFGVARALGRLSQTSPGGLKGKIWYMSPEQASSGHVDRRSDIFALGVVLWEAVCGRRLFRRDSELATLRAIVDEPIPPPSRIVRISPRLERIVMRALEKRPEDRFDDAEEIALALERHAFASEGFSPAQVAGSMKSLFGSEHARWKKTVAAAMDLESDEVWPDTVGTVLMPRSELATRGPTVLLQPSAPAPLTSSTMEMGSDTRSASSMEFTLPDPLPRPDRRVLAGVAALVCGLVIIVATLMFSRPKVTVTTVVRAGGGQTIQSLPPPAVSPPPAPAPAAAVPAPGAGGATDDGAGPAQASSDAEAAGRGAAPAGMREKATEPRHTARAAETAKPVSRAAAPAGTCALTIGTHPWAEVWIDGKNTKLHTPYQEKIACGKHRLLLRRWELDLSKTVMINLRPGETFKQSFALR